MPKKFFLQLFFLTVFLVGNTPLYAQLNTDQVDRATRGGDALGREEKERMERVLRIAPEKPAEPEVTATKPAKDEPVFFVRKITLTGCESFPADSFSTQIKKYEGKDLTLSELQDCASAVEREYLKRGVIAAVFVPEQESKIQDVSLQVVEARMGQLTVHRLKYFRDSNLTRYWRIKPGEILRYDKMVRSIQMMNKNPDREVKAALRAGKKPGTTDVILTSKTNFPAHGTFTFDKEGVTSTGIARMGYGIRHNNFLGLDDTMITGYTFGNAFFGSYVYHSVPVNSRGTSFLYGYSRSHSVPKKEYASTGLLSELKNTTVSLHQDIYGKDQYLGEAYLGFDASDKIIRADPGNMTPNPTKDRLRIARLGANFIHRGFGSTTYFSTEFSQGLTAFGASSVHNPNASRGAKSNFGKVTASITHRTALPLSLQANLKLKGQYADTKLTPQEEFSMGGIDSIRGYPAGDYLADSAGLASVELLAPAFFIPSKFRIPYAEKTLKEQTTLLFFVDSARGTKRSPGSGEIKLATFTGVGAGVRVKIFNQALLRLEYGIPIGDRIITESGRSQLHMAVEFQDMLPEEVERIRQMRLEENIEKWSYQLVNLELRNPDSRLRKKLNHYIYLARAFQKERRTKEARDLYANALALAKSVYETTQDYLRNAFAQQDELRQLNKEALELCKEDKPAEARKIWNKIVSEAKTEPLILEF